MIDMSFIEHYIPNIAEMLNVEPATVLLLLAVLGLVTRMIARIIPDTATGWKSVVRQVCMAISLYVPNRVTPGVTETKVHKEVAKIVKPESSDGVKPILLDAVDRYLDSQRRKD